MNSTKRLLRWAAGIMLVLGVGHLILLALASWEEITGWVDQGLWAAVPLELSGTQTVESLQNKVTFWAGPGSFAVPLILLGLLIWRLAGHGVAVPAWIGWGLAVWCVLGGVLLVPSPYFVGAVAGVLIIWAARQDDRPESAAGRYRLIPNEPHSTRAERE
ncbi:DUF6463 family protein [Nocardia abscessus]|jgi:hypothetical protein|uniref:DUF6463 family protein n=1 Tax=Nocardia abscessus TaxID=120957 RepID=UPI001E2EC36F|nr:DUF6463 family protein [Nocardia abscessus]